MENNDIMVTEPVIEQITKAEEMLPQSQVNGLVAKERKAAQEQLLKELGIEDIKSAKEGISKVKELQEAQKTDLQKAIERAEKAEQLIAGYESEKKDRESLDNISSILKNKDIDVKYAKTIKKLIGNAEINEELVLQTINDELPILVSDAQIKIGVEKKEEMNLPKSNIYLDAFNKMKK